MAAYIALFISLVCLILLIILLLRFKKLFSTDAIIEKTRMQMNKMITDINNNANRDMELINDSSRRVRALIAESDKKMEQFKQASERLHDMIAISEQTDKKDKMAEFKIVPEKPVAVDPEATYRIPDKQGTLFDENETKVTPDGAAYREVPVITTKLYEEKPIINKSEKKAKQLNEDIRKLFNEGLEIEEIAKKLSCSITEVQFIIDML